MAAPLETAFTARLRKTDVARFDDMLLSHLVYAYLYPWLSLTIGIAPDTARVFFVNVTMYSAYLGVDNLDALLADCRCIARVYRDADDDVDEWESVWKEYELAYGDLAGITGGSIVEGGDPALEDFNEWGVRAREIDVILWRDGEEHVVEV